MIYKQQIIEQFRSVGLKKGDIVLVHSSLKSIGETVEGGPDGIIDALIETVGNEGTILMPTFTGNELLSYKNPPVFDVNKTPCWTGIIPETFRQRKDVIRSLHPTHSVAVWGSKSRYFVFGHEESLTPCGWDTPFGKLIKHDGKVLFIGVGLECNTLFHTCEEIAGVSYHLQKEPVVAKIILDDNNIKTVKIKIHWYNENAIRDFTKLEPLFVEKKILTYAKLGKATLRLLLAKPMYEITMELLKSDPEVLLKKNTVKISDITIKQPV